MFSRLPFGWLVCMFAVVVGVVYGWMIPPGLPYDEPSHWSVVEFIARTHAVPDLHAPGVTYEAQQGPVAYVLDALVAGLVRGFSSDVAAFYVTRLLGVVEFLAAVYLMSAIVRRLGVSRVAAYGATAAFALDPMFVAMFSSVQNDGLMLVLGFLSIHVVLSAPAPPSARRSTVVGVIAGLALVTKLTVAPLFIGYLAWLAWRSGPRLQCLIRALAFLLAAGAVSGWWFLLNLLRYGALTPPTDLGGGPSFPAYGLRLPATAVHLAEGAVTYLWVPDEYFRNVIALPGWAKALIVTITIAIVILAVLEFVRHRRSGSLTPDAISAWRLIGITGLAALIGWVVTFVFVSAVAPRFGYLALPLWTGATALAIDCAARRMAPVWRPWVALAIPAVAVALNAWVIGAIAELRLPVALLPLG